MIVVDGSRGYVHAPHSGHAPRQGGQTGASAPSPDGGLEIFLDDTILKCVAPNSAAPGFLEQGYGLAAVLPFHVLTWYLMQLLFVHNILLIAALILRIDRFIDLADPIEPAVLHEVAAEQLQASVGEERPFQCPELTSQ